jgi:hypothetical protein
MKKAGAMTGITRKPKPAGVFVPASFYKHHYAG